MATISGVSVGAGALWRYCGLCCPGVSASAPVLLCQTHPDGHHGEVVLRQVHVCQVKQETKLRRNLGRAAAAKQQPASSRGSSQPATSSRGRSGNSIIVSKPRQKRQQPVSSQPAAVAEAATT